jgi:scyllo-inositol 2-dehydrogenase (NADP+)
MKKVLYVYGGPDFHPTERCGKILADVLKGDGRFELEMTADLDSLAKLPQSDYAAVVVNATGFKDDLTPAREKGLLEFVKSGKGFVGLHSATDTFRGSKAYVDMIGGEFLHHPANHEYPVKIVDKEHYVTTRVPDFNVYDEMYHLQNHDPSKVKLLASTTWLGETKPVVYVKEYGKGRVAYNALGHTMEAWRHPEFLKLTVRCVAWACGAEKPAKALRCAMLGWGPACDMGKGHANWINSNPGMKAVAMCDIDPARVAVAKEEAPDLEGYFTSLDDLLKMPDLDLIVNILPHNLHAPTTLKCLDAGKHVVLEKPFCITVDEANAMISKAKEKKLMLSLFHNRRWDGDYLTIKDLIARGLIGDVFRIECGQEGYGHPGFWWRSTKEISGGVMYDWGAHFLDWILNLFPGAKITQVTGDFQKRMWHAVTNEDHGEAMIRFENGVIADYVTSTISANGRPKWRICGTLGAIQANWGDIDLVSYASGVRLESKVKVTLPGYGSTEYYRNVADHLLFGEELVVKPEQARRVIGVIDAAQRSSASGTSVAPAKGCE